MKQVYPLGEQNFREIRESGKIYVDKTHFIPVLIDNKFFFLSRPRRFGKSLFLSTLENFFKGRRELFRGLAVDSMPWVWEEYPVIRINLAEGSFSKGEGLEQRLSEILYDIATDYNVKISGVDPRMQFRNLIKALNDKFDKKVVILIDEYEKPLLDSIYAPHHEEYRRRMADFYSVLKSNEELIRFLFITGVTRFGHLNIFSGFNNLTDISLLDEFSAICGITQKELEDNFHNGIETLAKSKNIGYEDALYRLKKYYDGYHFSAKLEDIYNPYSLLYCLRFSQFASNWIMSGSSRYLIESLRNNQYDFTRLENIKASWTTLLGADATMEDSVTLLYQSGYLTIKAYDERRDIYTLGLPNQEVSEALYSAIIPFYLGDSYKEPRERAYDFIEMLETGKAEQAMNWLKGYFGSIPYDVKLNFEAEFQHIVYAFFALTGLLSGSTLEKQTSDGRIDLVLTIKNYVYIFEFKLGNDAEKALDQIVRKEYSLQWQSSGKQVVKIGVAFSPETRGIASFKIVGPQ